MANILNLGLSAVATGTSDVITATYSPAITLSDRRIVFLTNCVANTTTTPTFSPNALTARVIKAKGGVALKVGEILGDCILVYHVTGTYWELLTSNYQPQIDTKLTSNVTNTTNVAADITGLVVTLVAGKTYRVTGTLHTGCNNTGGTFYSIDCPNDAILHLSYLGTTNSLAALANRYIDVFDGETNAVLNNVNNAFGVVNINGTIDVVTGGTFQMKFRSAVDTQTSTIYKLGTFMVFTEL